MDASSQYELEMIKKELQGIAEELNRIAYGVQRDFEGIGNETCSRCIYRAANHYTDVKKRLTRIDTSAVTEEFLARQESEQQSPAKQNRPQIYLQTESRGLLSWLSK